MTQENPQRLPREVEFQIKKDRLANALTQIEGKSESFEHGLPKVVAVSLAPTIYFVEGDDAFGVYFAKRDDAQGKHRIIRIDAYKQIDSFHEGRKLMMPYDSHVGFKLLEEDPDGTVNGRKEQPLHQEEYDGLIELTEDMYRILSDERFSEDEPIEIPPDSFRRYAQQLYNSEGMKYERISKEFYGVMSELGRKAKKVRVDKRKYQNLHNIIVLRQTPWVTVEVEGKDAEFRLQLVDGYSNGGWQDDYRIQRRNPGDKKNERSLFYGGDANSYWKGVFDLSFATSEEVGVALDLLKKVNEATPSPKKSS
jgi:hypothetical protein